MDELTPPHAPAPTPDELGRLRVRMADAVAGCAGCLTTVAALSEATPPTAAARRERCNCMGDGIDSLSKLTSEFHQAHRAAGGGWPADAPSGLTFGVVATTLHDAYFVGYRMWHSLCESGQERGPATDALAAGLLRAGRTLEDAAEYLRPVGGWSPADPGAAAATARALRRASEGLSRMQHIGLGEIDAVTLPGPRGPTRTPVTFLACRVVRGDRPTLCPAADPALPSTLLPDVARRVRELVGLPAGLTIHWTGHEAGMRGSCRCHPDAPTAAPADVGQWPEVVPSRGDELTGPADEAAASQSYDHSITVAAAPTTPGRECVAVAAAMTGVTQTLPVESPVKKGSKGKHINARMLAALQEQGDLVAGRSAQQWADALGCRKSSVIETPTWRLGLGVQRVAQGLKNKAKKSRRR